jgi:hypothetical protein
LFVSERVSETFSGEKKVFLASVSWKTDYTHDKRIKLHLLLTLDTKLNSKCIKYLNVTAKTVKLL